MESKGRDKLVEMWDKAKKNRKEKYLYKGEISWGPIIRQRATNN